MKKIPAIPLSILVDLRQIFFGRRSEIAEKAQMHYNSVGAVLKGELYNEKILQAMIDLMHQDEDEEVRTLCTKVGKLIKSKQRTVEAA